MEKIKATQKQMVKIEELINEVGALTSAKIVIKQSVSSCSDVDEVKKCIDRVLQSKAGELIEMFEI